MNDLEDRLKDAYAAAVSTVKPENIRQRGEQSVVITWPAAKPPRPARRWAIPLTAAAVLAIIAAAALPTFLTTGGGNTPLSPVGEHFLSALTPHSAKFFILNSASGAKTATVPLPRPRALFQAAATGNGVTYVAAVGQNDGCQTWLYRFRLNSAGKPGPLKPFDGGFLRARVSQLQLSADGRTFAYLAHRCGVTGSKVNVVNLASGQHRQWSLPKGAFTSPLSLSENGGWLTFASGPIDRVQSAVYLLNTSGAPGPVGRSQLLINGTRFGHDAELGQPIVSLNGRVVYFTSFTGSVASPAEQVRSVNTSTGKLRFIAKANGGIFALAADPSVRRAIVKIQADVAEPAASMVNLKTGKFTMVKPSFYVPGDGEYIW